MTSTNTGYTINITYSSVDEQGFTVDSNTIKFNALTIGKNKTLITDGNLIFALAEAPTEQGLLEYFTKRFNNSEKTVSSIAVIETVFDALIFERAEEMEKFRAKASRVQAKADAMFEEFQIKQQAFVLLF